MLTGPELTAPGSYRYLDPIGGPAQDVEVRESGGKLVAIFQAMEPDDAGEEYLVSDMAGEFEGPLD